MIAAPRWPEFWDLWAAGRWEPDTHAVIVDRMADGGTFVDLGAWIGPTALWALHAGADRVVAVEPDPVAADALRGNTDGYPVTVVQAAVTATTGGTILYRAEAWGDSMSTLVLRHGDGQYVDTVTLPDLWAETEPGDVALVKMDVEGAEAAILEAHGDWLAGHCAALLLSVHSAWGGAEPLAHLDGWELEQVRQDEWLAVPA